MDRASFINKYSGFDTPDIAQRIAKRINEYIKWDGIEYLPYREVHGRHTGYLDISNGGFRMDYDFLYPVLAMCRLDRDGVVSADIRKIEKCLDDWRSYLYSISDEELEYKSEDYYNEDDDLHAFRNAAYKAEMDSFLKLDSPSYEEIVSHEEALENLKDLSFADNIDCTAEAHPEFSDQLDVQDKTSDSPSEREGDSNGEPVYTDEEIAIYEQEMEDMEIKEDALLNKCREIFYTEGKEVLHEYLNDVEDYSSKQKGCDCYDDPEYFEDYEIKKIRERFEVWDKEKERLRMEKMYERMQQDVDDYWNDPNREQRADWVSPTLVQDVKDYFE